MSEFLGFWKSYTSRKVNALGLAVAAGVDRGGSSCGKTLRWPRSAPSATTLWQREFFDHVLRSVESYGQKWDYVKENPVRAGLVKTSDGDCRLDARLKPSYLGIRTCRNGAVFSSGLRGLSNGRWATLCGIGFRASGVIGRWEPPQ